MINLVSVSELKIIVNLLKTYNNEFSPPLSARVKLEDYVEKVYDHGEIYKYHDENIIKGVMFIYMNDYINYSSYLSLILVEFNFRKSKENIGKELMQFWINTAISRNMKSLNLEVASDRIGLIHWYESFGFKIVESNDRVGSESYKMRMEL